jgi:hypothetical protein
VPVLSEWSQGGVSLYIYDQHGPSNISNMYTGIQLEFVHYSIKCNPGFNYTCTVLSLYSM